MLLAEGRRARRRAGADAAAATAARSSTTTEGRQLEDEITSAELVKKLHALEDRPWNEWGG